MMVCISKRLFYSLLGWGMGLLVLGGMNVEAARGQTYTRPEHQGEVEQTGPGQDRGTVGDLPSWAEPAEPRGPSSTNAKSAAAPPDPPGDPTQVPVDGGVALLAAAGAGYAVRKLSEEEEEDPPV